MYSPDVRAKAGIRWNLRSLEYELFLLAEDALCKLCKFGTNMRLLTGTDLR
jgi:hypothetical protein